MSAQRFAGGGGVRSLRLWTGLVRLHILHHAAEGEVFGLGIIRELQRHGYDLSPGTIYPMLHGLEEAGYLTSKARPSKGPSRRGYRATRSGRIALAEARKKVRELFAELTAARGSRGQ
jgi:DNA-binding PadR family transcriptional regulator